MKLYGQSVFVVDEYGSIFTNIRKTKEFADEFNTHTGGFIKYLDLPKGTMVLVTIEVIEDGHGCQ